MENNAKPVALWLFGLQLAALWPHWVWMIRRTGDGSDEPWGIVALLSLAAVLYVERRDLSTRVPGLSLVAAGLISACAALALAVLPPIIAATVAVLAVVVLLSGLLPADRPRIALAGIALLALPLTASLNFYLGYPLRWVTAHGAALLLGAFGTHVTPEGAALLWNGKTILIDAPCAGIAMLWVGLFTAVLFSYIHRASNLRTTMNVCAAVIIVIAANFIRNAVLFYKEAGITPLPHWTHEAIGLMIFGLAIWPIHLIASRRQHVKN